MPWDVRCRQCGASEPFERRHRAWAYADAHERATAHTTTTHPRAAARGRSLLRIALAVVMAR